GESAPTNAAGKRKENRRPVKRGPRSKRVPGRRKANDLESGAGHRGDVADGVSANRRKDPSLAAGCRLAHPVKVQVVDALAGHAWRARVHSGLSCENAFHSIRTSSGLFDTRLTSGD